MDRMGEGTTQAGMIMGIVMTCFPILIVGAYIALILFVFFISLLSGVAG